MDVIKNGFFEQSETSGYDIPDYKSRYDFFISEFVSHNIDIPDDLKIEYNMLFSIYGVEQNDKSIKERLEKFKVNINDEVPMPEIVLSVCDVNGQNKRMVMTRENISCVTAQAKVGKTFLVKLIVSAILKKGVFQNRLLSELPDGRDKILYIDTEQSKFHVKLGLSQIKEMLGSDNEKELERMDVYQFDAISTLNRLEYVKWLIYNSNPDFVILDGISDLALDTNNLKEADELVTNLRIWATENNCHILNVIHQNPNDIQTKMKGHLGTKLQDKSEIVIGVSIDKENENNRIVQSLASRNRKPEPFEFTITEHGVPEINEYEVSQAKLNGKKQQKTDKPDYQLYQILTSIYSKTPDKLGYRYGELISGIILNYEKMFNESIGDSVAKKLLTKFIDKDFILKTGSHGFSEYFLGEFSSDNFSITDNSKAINSINNNENEPPF